MGLKIGDLTASSGMSKAIFDKLNDILSPPLEDTSAEDMEKIRDSWQKLAYSIAKGVIEHIKANMEIYGIQTQGDINTTVTGDTGEALSHPNNHDHEVNLPGAQNDVILTQSNDGTGRVR